MNARLEHVNLTVSDNAAFAAMLSDLFGWQIRWQGDAIAGGHTIHIGTGADYLAVYQPPEPAKSTESSYDIAGGLNHVGVLVDDLDAAEARVAAAGFQPRSHADYEPGRRFYFDALDGIEIEVISYR